jgi:hypothetical protein
VWPSSGLQFNLEDPLAPTNVGRLVIFCFLLVNTEVFFCLLLDDLILGKRDWGGAWACGIGHLAAGNPGRMFTDDVFVFGLQLRGFPPRRRTVAVLWFL